MPVVSMVNWKGGVGKTTLTVALADFLSTIHGRNVLVIDMDPQASASVSLLGEAAWKVVDDTKRTVADLFANAIRGSVLSEALQPGWFVQPVSRVWGASGQVHVVASSLRLQLIEERAMETLASWSPYVGSPYTLLQQPFFMQMMSAYDYVIIDCPPSIGMITLNAITISSGYIIPVNPDYLSTAGLALVSERATQHANRIHRHIPFFGTVLNRVRHHALQHAMIVEELRARPEAQPLWDTTIPETMPVQEVLRQPTELMTLKDRYGGGSHANYMFFEALAQEFLQRVS